MNWGTAPDLMNKLRKSSTASTNTAVAIFRVSEIPPIKTLTLKMAGAMSAETSEPFEHSVQVIPESRSHELSSHRENLMKKHCLILVRWTQRF